MLHTLPPVDQMCARTSEWVGMGGGGGSEYRERRRRFNTEGILVGALFAPDAVKLATTDCTGLRTVRYGFFPYRIALAADLYGTGYGTGCPINTGQRPVLCVLVPFGQTTHLDARIEPYTVRFLRYGYRTVWGTCEDRCYLACLRTRAGGSIARASDPVQGSRPARLKTVVGGMREMCKQDVRYSFYLLQGRPTSTPALPLALATTTPTHRGRLLPRTANGKHRAKRRGTDTNGQEKRTTVFAVRQYVARCDE
ncbi:hypothetical protein C8F01DRAFT_1229554 [Mycena amicta]|nr:hypothetical protein C8F01DRAFT_1229554 [Mycena amicta]